MPVMNMLPGGSTLQIPLDAPTSLTATAGNAQVELTWTDPKDKYATPEGEVSETGDQLVSEWSHTVVVRKTGSQPAGPDDGTVVVSSSVRNQYQSTPYTDTGLTNDTEYFYGVFAYNKDGVASPGTFVSATPKAGTPLSELTEGTIIKINENGSPVEFYLAKHSYEPGLNGAGRELVVRKDIYNSQSWNRSNSSHYPGSVIDNWLGTTYKGLFSASVQAGMGATEFYIIQGDRNTTRITYSASCFLPSVNEFGRSWSGVPAMGSELPVAAQMRAATLNGSPSDKWTRSSTEGNGVIYISPTGEAGQTNDGTPCGILPCFALPSGTLCNSDLELIETSIPT